MFKNLLKTAFRNILKHKTYSLINIIGLSIGLTCAILILLWIQDERSMDNYHAQRNDICQAYLKSTREDNVNYQSTTAPAIAEILKTEYPEVRDAVRIGALEELVLKVDDKQILENRGIAADPSLFKIFTYQFLQGNPEIALNNPRSIVLTESMARKYFGPTNAMGQMIRFQNEFDMKVTGIIQDLPQNTHRPFDFIAPFQFLRDLGQNIDGMMFFPCKYLTYVLLEPNSDYQLLSEKISERTFSQGDLFSFEIILKPFHETYFFDTDGMMKIAILTLIALIILGTACINFMNLSTARSSIRAKEIGIRKVTGAGRLQIARQFIGESILLTCFSTIIALILTEVVLRFFNQISGKSLAMNFSNLEFLFSLIGLTMLTGFAAGLYPALYLSRFQPMAVLKQNILSSRRSGLRKVLFVTQFVLSITFIIASLVINRQLHYINGFDLGVNDSNMVYVHLDGDIRNQIPTLKQELLRNTNIQHVATASTLPTSIRTGSFFNWGVPDGPSIRICESRVGYDYLKAFELEMAEGRFFSDKFPSDMENGIIVNETAMQEAGLDISPGESFYYGDRYLTLIGIMKDFHHDKSLRNKPAPLSFRLSPNHNTYLFAKVNPSIAKTLQFQKTVNFISSTCRTFSPDRPLVLQLLPDHTIEFERTMAVVKQIIFFSTILAILVSSLGLFGLSAFLNEQRTKETGIRKVLGASQNGLILNASREFAQWILVANVIAWPIAFFAMKGWLQNFAYRVSLDWWIFLSAGMIAIVISFVTVSYHSIRAARANPIEALKYE